MGMVILYRRKWILLLWGVAILLLIIFGVSMTGLNDTKNLFKFKEIKTTGVQKMHIIGERSSGKDIRQLFDEGNVNKKIVLELKNKGNPNVLPTDSIRKKTVDNTVTQSKPSSIVFNELIYQLEASRTAREKNSDQSRVPTRSIQTKKCTPAKSVIFLKTHKTGSSTITNIMQRYADAHDLKVALPKNHIFFGWPNTFEDKYVLGYKPGIKYNILMNHARFHRDRMLNIMADKDTKIVTIIRDPLYQFESAVVYYKFKTLFDLDNKLNMLDAFFIKSKEDIYARVKERKTDNEVLAKNPITYDMGFSAWNENQADINAVLEKVKSSYNLVMISDYMAESLVMLKEKLCWDSLEIAYFTMNKRPDEYRQQMTHREKLREKVKNWNKIDYAIFEHYNKTFWQGVHKGGQQFQRNVEKLRETNKWLKEKCLDAGHHFDKSQPWFPIMGFKLKEESKEFRYRALCENMIRSEIEYTNLLKKKRS